MTTKNRFKIVLTTVTVVAALFALSGSANAESVTIPNPGFEENMLQDANIAPVLTAASVVHGTSFAVHGYLLPAAVN